MLSADSKRERRLSAEGAPSVSFVSTPESTMRSSVNSFTQGRRMTLTEEHNALPRRLPGVASAPAASTAGLSGDHVALITRLEAGVHERDVLLKNERHRFKDEMSKMQHKLKEAEQRESETHAALLLAQQDQVALIAANRRNEELQRGATAHAEKLQNLSEAEDLNQQKHTLLLEQLETERKKRLALEMEIERMRVEHDKLLSEQRREGSGTLEAAERRHAAALEACQLEGERVLTQHRKEAEKELEHARKHIEELCAKLQQREDLVKSTVAKRAASRLFKAATWYCFSTWVALADRAERQLRKKELLTRVAMTLLRRSSVVCFQHWRGWYRSIPEVEARRARMIHVMTRITNYKKVLCWNTWKENWHDELLNLAKLTGTQPSEGLQTATTDLDELFDAVQALEIQRREERARLEAEVAALSDALRHKREMCEKLRKANAQVIGQFEAAEHAFLDAEQRRAESQATSVVGRIVEAVFGLEPPSHNEAVQTLVQINRRGYPSDRLAVTAEVANDDTRLVSYHQGHKTRKSSAASKSKKAARAAAAAAERERRAAAAAAEEERLVVSRRPSGSIVVRPIVEHRRQSPPRIEARLSPEKADREARELVQRARARAERQVTIDHMLASPKESQYYSADDAR